MSIHGRSWVLVLSIQGLVFFSCSRCCAYELHIGMPAHGTVLAIQPAEVSYPSAQTNNLPFSDSFETYLPGTSPQGLNGWNADPATECSVVAASGTLEGGVYPLATNHTQYLDFSAYDSFASAVTGAQTHVWADMLLSFVLMEDAPSFQADDLPQIAFYLNADSNLVAYARTANSSSAGLIVSDCTVHGFGSFDARVFHRFSLQAAYLPAPTGACFSVYVDGRAVIWPGGERLPGLASETGAGLWLRAATASATHFPGIVWRGNGSLDDLTITDQWVFPATNLVVALSGRSELRWTSDFGRTYQVEACTNLAAGDWRSLGGSVHGNGLTNVLRDAETGYPSRFYRLRTDGL